MTERNKQSFPHLSPPTALFTLLSLTAPQCSPDSFSSLSLLSVLLAIPSKKGKLLLSVADHPGDRVAGQNGHIHSPRIVARRAFSAPSSSFAARLGS